MAVVKKEWSTTRHGVMRYLLVIASITEIIKSAIEVDSIPSKAIQNGITNL